MLFVQKPGDAYPISDRPAVPQRVIRLGPDVLIAYARRRCLDLGRVRWWLIQCVTAADGRAVIDRLRTHTDMGTLRGFTGPEPNGTFVAKGEL